MTKEEIQKLLKSYPNENDFLLVDLYETHWVYTNRMLTEFAWKTFENDKTQLLTFRNNFIHNPIIYLKNRYNRKYMNAILGYPNNDL